MRWKPEDLIAFTLTLTILIFLVLWSVLKLITRESVDPKNLELWTALISSIITGVFMYINRKKE